jgi:hypothetical protein
MECSAQGGEEPQPDEEGDMKVELVDYEVDPYEEALRNLLDGGGGDTFFYSERHSHGPNILHDEVCIFFNCLYNFKAFLFFSSIVFLYCLSIFVVFLIWLIPMIGIVCHQELVSWMWQQRVS